MSQSTFGRGLPTDAAYEAAAQRRHLTVIFCDLVDSTRLSGRCDPEDWRDAMSAYRRAATEAIERYGGHVAQFQGDALVAYLGFPAAHEEDASCAVHAGLAVLEAMEGVNVALEPLNIGRLEVRIGIHSGPAVVERYGYETTVVGVTTHVAARIQALARPGSVVVSENVRLLSAGEFVTSELGTFEMKGVDDPPRLHVVVGRSGVRSRLKGVERLTPFVGRQRQLRPLEAAWSRIKRGDGAGMLIVGEAGIGKSRLVLRLQQQLARDAHTWLECQASPYTTNAAFAPIVELVVQGLELTELDSAADKLAKLRNRLQADGITDIEDVVAILAPLLGLSAEPSSGAAGGAEARTRTIEALVRWTAASGARQPVLLLVEDLHWCDPSTLEYLQRLVRPQPPPGVLVLMTTRPQIDTSWATAAGVGVVALPRLASRAARAMLQSVDKASVLPDDLRDAIVRRADGIPLFVEELAKMMAAAAAHGQAGDGAGVIARRRAVEAVPETLHDLLAARLDSLGAAKETAQLAGVIGREVPLRLLQAVGDVPGHEIEARLAALVDAEILFVRGTGARRTYLFKHALIQDAACDSLLKATRRRVHGSVADKLVELFPEVAATQPEIIARHYTEAQRHVEAVPLWIAAGRHALECSAPIEAMAHAEAGLALVAHIHDEESRLRAELALQLVLGPSLMAIRGYADPAMEQAYGRAHEICRRLGTPPETFPVMFGLWTFHCVRARHEDAAGIAREMTQLADHESDSSLLMEADVCAGITEFYVGRFAHARQRLERVMDLYDPALHASHPLIYGQDPRAAALAHLMLTRWTLGDVPGALASAADAVALARSTDHPFSAGYALSFAAWLHHLRGDAAACMSTAEESIRVCGKRNLAVFLAIAEILKGSALVTLGQTGIGIARLEAGCARFAETASTLITPFWACLRAQAYAAGGRHGDALSAIEEALALAHGAGEVQAEAEIYRTRAALRSELRGSAAEIETDLARAVAIAEAQGAASWRLKAAIDLARHWIGLQRTSEAVALLAEARSAFSATCREADALAADNLLAQLGVNGRPHAAAAAGVHVSSRAI